METLLIACNASFENTWYLDSGASKHTAGNKKLLSNLVEASHGTVTLKDGYTYALEGVGEIVFKTKSGKVETMSEVYYVPNLTSNLLSVGHLMRKGFNMFFDNFTCILKKKDQHIANIGMNGNNIFPIKPDNFEAFCHLTVKDDVSKFVASPVRAS
ncbi:PREDICTED: uncharacterized protein LOC105961568 [Erythranthe guttata]|uniref:uncharacterized protein LOC105961568 n=1 Tax=Erythranthe guttata TaxID=4155 RepID=UPI00064DE63E|nr:PREDICTED: uncharacterized protein LOC105961568 [Erythranthe guttata]|eukprot:XP_012841252.1 PREDICTED: uncharacterized protein LOC105961568 [Erythranthe guttata]